MLDIRGRSPRLRLLAATSVAGLLAMAVPAAADQEILAARGQRYASPAVTIAQGERLTFRNGDSVQHDVTSTQDRDGKPLFATPLIDPKGEAVVEGSQYLTTGEYAFYCSVHPDMQGKLTVTAEGTPAVRPGEGGSAAVTPAAARLAAVKRSRTLAVDVTGTAGADAIVAAQATIHGKRVKLAKARVTLTSAGPQRVALPLSKAGRSALKGVRRVSVRFKATVLAPSGPSAATAKRTYR